MAPFSRDLLLVLAAGAVADSTLRVSWNTDFTLHFINDSGPIGPDGPWQAPILTTSNGKYVPLLPSILYGITVPGVPAGGQYDPPKSARQADPFGLQSNDIGDPDYLKVDSNFTTYFDNWSIEGDKQSAVNVTVFEATKWNIVLPNSKHYTPRIGSVGFSSPDDSDGDDGSSRSKAPTSILQQLKSDKTIGSRSFGMHMGSAKLRQSGSLILGGYDQSRALGDVGKWVVDDVLGLFLKDITLGVEQGGSPFVGINITNNAPASLWQGLGGNEVGNNNTRQAGGPDGSALTVPLATLSPIYLPKGNCEAIAKHLPVTWRKDIGYYVWNTNDQQYSKIVSSPAYLGFVFATPEAKNLTVKVPFGLLNLTLESPIVSSPTTYFPCQSYDGLTGIWPLGRAFLQAAFMHMDFEKPAMYLAQGPGPTLEQSVIQPFSSGDNIKSNPISSFAKTWQSHWRVLPEDGKSEKQRKKGLAPGAIAGIVIGVVAGLAAVGVLVWFLRRRKSKAKADEGINGASEEEPKESGAGELQGSGGIHEAPGAYLSHEVQGETPNVRYEMPDHSQPLELYGDEPNTQVLQRKPLP